jgi:hypothetical protein
MVWRQVALRSKNPVVLVRLACAQTGKCVIHFFLYCPRYLPDLDGNVSQLKCSWPRRQDRRLPPSPHVVEKLQTRISTLKQTIRTYERRLRENGHSIDFESPDDNTDSDALSDGEASGVDDMTISLGKLVVSGSSPCPVPHDAFILTPIPSVVDRQLRDSILR